MAIRVRIKLNRKGVGEVLHSANVEGELHYRGLRIAEAVEAANIRVDGDPGKEKIPVTVTTSGRGTRSRTYVTLDHPSGAAVEAKHGILVASIDAARVVDPVVEVDD